MTPLQKRHQSEIFEPKKIPTIDDLRLTIVRLNSCNHLFMRIDTDLSALRQRFYIYRLASVSR
jgi:hypothetical protein